MNLEERVDRIVEDLDWKGVSVRMRWVEMDGCSTYGETTARAMVRAALVADDRQREFDQRRADSEPPAD